MQLEVECADRFAKDAYAKLFEDIMADIGKATLIEAAHLLLKPDGPLFVFSVRLKADPVDKTIGDVANVREEGAGVHVTISDERYAPNILDQLWKKYGRAAVYQQTRFDMNVDNAKLQDVSALVVASGEEMVREIVGALWRSMPEGIKNRHSFIDGSVVTVVATEERFTPELIQAGRDIHVKMGGVA